MFLKRIGCRDVGLGRDIRFAGFLGPDALQLGDIGANADLVTGGISEALVSTAAGLVVAIGTLLFANLFRGLYKRQVALIQEYGGQLEILYETHYERQQQLVQGGAYVRS